MGDGKAGVGDCGGVVVVSAGHVVGTHGSGIVSSAADMLGMTGARDERSWQWKNRKSMGQWPHVDTNQWAISN